MHFTTNHANHYKYLRKFYIYLSKITSVNKGQSARPEEFSSKRDTSHHTNSKLDHKLYVSALYV